MNAPTLKPLPTAESAADMTEENSTWPHWPLVLGALFGGVALPLYVLDGTRPVDGWPAWALLGAIAGAVVVKSAQTLHGFLAKPRAAKA